MGKNDAAERVLAAIREESRQEYLPVASELCAEELSSIVRERAPMRVLEVGVLTGHLSVRIALDLPKGGMLVGVDIAEGLLRRARANVDLAGLGDRVEFVRGDAREVLAGLEGPFDMVVLDAERSQYLSHLRAVESKLSPGAVIFAIGTDAQDSRVRKYLDHVRLSGAYDSVALVLEDAVEISVRS